MPIGKLRLYLSGFRDDDSYAKLTKERMNAIIIHMHKQGLIRKLRKNVWIPLTHSSITRLREL